MVVAAEPDRDLLRLRDGHEHKLFASDLCNIDCSLGLSNRSHQQQRCHQPAACALVHRHCTILLLVSAAIPIDPSLSRTVDTQASRFARTSFRLTSLSISCLPPV